MRKSWAEAAGVDWNAIKSYDDYRNAAFAITDEANEKWGWGLTYLASDGSGLIMDCIQAHGGSITDASGMVVNFNSPQTLEAVNWLVDTYTNEQWQPMLPPGVDSWTDSSNNEAYLAGKLGLTKNSFSLYGNMKRDTPEVYEDTAVLNRPQTTTGELLEAGAAAWLVVFKGAKNIDAAKDYCLHMLEPEVFNPMVEVGAGLFLPCYTNLWTDETLTYDPNMPKLKEIMFNPTDYRGFAHPAEGTALHSSISAASILGNMMSKAVVGEMTPEEAVQDAHERIVVIWEEGGVPQA
jgi:multiple sugar transport system substrate-binding protein